jgi:hypothetical protein
MRVCAATTAAQWRHDADNCQAAAGAAHNTCKACPVWSATTPQALTRLQLLLRKLTALVMCSTPVAKNSSLQHTQRRNNMMHQLWLVLVHKLGCSGEQGWACAVAAESGS